MSSEELKLISETLRALAGGASTSTNYWIIFHYGSSILNGILFFGGILLAIKLITTTIFKIHESESSDVERREFLREIRYKLNLSEHDTKKKIEELVSKHVEVRNIVEGT